MRVHMTPIQKDAVVFLASLGALLASVWAAVSFGVSFTPGSAGIAVWAVALVVVVGLVFAASAFWWYYVAPAEREPARGEWTYEPEPAAHPAGPERRAGGGHIRAGEGSFRTKVPGPGAVEEPQYRMTEDAGFVPRTLPRWVAWIVVMGLAVAASGVLVAYSRNDPDPASWLLVATGLLGGAVMLGALAVGEMGATRGSWWRREPKRPGREA